MRVRVVVQEDSPGELESKKYILANSVLDSLLRAKPTLQSCCGEEDDRASSHEFLTKAHLPGEAEVREGVGPFDCPAVESIKQRLLRLYAQRIRAMAKDLDAALTKMEQE